MPNVECTLAGRPVANRRILVITDYLPPQTHGLTCAFKCSEQVEAKRAWTGEWFPSSSHTGGAANLQQFLRWQQD